jgi:uncharacterized membrane protein
MDAKGYLVLRVLHILAAALWLGAAGLLALIVMPAIRDAGRAGGSLLALLHRRKLHVFMAASAVATVLSGIGLYWVLTAGFDQALVLSRSGIVFGVGGLCGLLAMIIGGSVIGPGFVRILALTEQTASVPERDMASHAQSISGMQQRTALAARVALEKRKNAEKRDGGS